MKRHSAPSLLDARGALLTAALALPCAVLLFVALRPWAAGLEPADFATAEGIAAAPLVAVLLTLVVVAYRPLLQASIVDRRRIREVRLGSTGLGLAVFSAPVVVGLFAPLFAGGRVVPTLVIGAAIAVVEVFVLERQRRGSSGRQLRWFDPALEYYRLRWGATLVAVAVLGALFSVQFTAEGPNYLAALATYAIPLVFVSPYLVVFLAMIEDEQLHAARRALGASPLALMLCVPVLAAALWGAEQASMWVAAGSVATLLPLLERARRSAIAVHLRRINDAGDGEAAAASYPGLVRRRDRAVPAGRA